MKEIEKNVNYEEKNATQKLIHDIVGFGEDDELELSSGDEDKKHR